MTNVELLARGLLAKRRPSDVLSRFLDFAFFCRACEPSKVLRLPAKTKVRPCAQRVESPAPWHIKKRRKTSKIEAKIDPKSSKIASRARPGGLVARLCALEGARSSFPRPPSSPQAARASQPGRPGSHRHARVSQARQAPSGNIVIDIYGSVPLSFRLTKFNEARYAPAMRRGGPGVNCASYAPSGSWRPIITICLVSN